MKRIATSVVTLALACLGMPGDVKGAGGTNDRYFLAQISPSVTETTAPIPYKLTVQNDDINGPNHFIRNITVTVPSAFVLVNITGTTSPVTPPPLWKVQSITPLASTTGVDHTIVFW